MSLLDLGPGFGGRHRLDLDFGARARRAPRMGIVLLAAGALLAVASTLRVADFLAASASYGARLHELDASTSAARPKPAAKASIDPRAAPRVAATRQVAQSLQSPWGDLLDVLEVRPEASVALLSVEPSAVKRTVQITAEARDPHAMLEHLAMLQRDSRLSDVTLLSHQRQTQAPGAPWRYQIQASW